MKGHTVPAAVLAAGREREAVSQAAGVAHKALVQVAGQPVAARVVSALRQARLVDEVVVVTAPGSPVVEALRGKTRSTVAESDSFLGTIRAGFAHHADRDRLLVATCELPLLSGEAVDHFVAAALDSGAELCYSMVQSETLQAIDPDGSAVVVHLKEGDYRGGNLALLSRDFIEREGERLNRAFAGRKNAIQLAAMLGVGFIMRLLLRRLSVDDIVQRARELLHCEAAVVCSPYPGVGFDLDKPEQIAVAEALLSR